MSDLELCFQNDQGCFSLKFVTNLDKLLVKFENGKVLVACQKFSFLKEIIPLF